MRRLLKPLWIFLALVFVFEAWLWNKLEPIVERIVAIIPWHALKERVASLVEGLPPYLTLVIFVVPHGVAFLTETTLIWLFKDVWWVVAAVLIMAKVVGVGLAAFLFQATKPKLLEIPWFRWGYETILAGLAWAHRLADPYIAVVRAWMADLRRRAVAYAGRGGFFRTVRAIRARVRRASST